MNTRVLESFLVGLVVLLLGTAEVLAVDILKIKFVGGSLEPGKNGEPLKYYHEYIIENTADYAVPLDGEPFELPEYVASVYRVIFCENVLDDTQYEYDPSTHTLTFKGVSINAKTTCTLTIEAFTVPPLYSTITMRPSGGNTYELIVSLSPYTTNIDRVIPIVIPKNALTCNISSVEKKYPRDTEAWDVEFFEGKDYYYIIVKRHDVSHTYYILQITSSKGVCVYKNERIYLHQFSRVAGYDLGREEIMGYEVSKEVGDLLNASYAIPKPFTSPYRYAETVMDYSGDTGKYTYKSVVEPSVYFERTFSGVLQKKCSLKIDRSGMIYKIELEKKKEEGAPYTKSGDIYVGKGTIGGKEWNLALVDKEKENVYDTLCISEDEEISEDECIIPIYSREESVISREYILNEELGLPEEFVYRVMYYTISEDGQKAEIFYSEVPADIAGSSDPNWRGVPIVLECSVSKNGKEYSKVFLDHSDFKTLLLTKPDPNKKYYVASKITPGEIFRVRESGKFYMMYDIELSRIQVDNPSSLKEGDTVGEISFVYYHEAKDKTRYRILAYIENAYVPPVSKDSKWGVKRTIFIGYDDSKRVVVLDYGTTGNCEDLLNSQEDRILEHGTHQRISEESNRVFFVYIEYDPENGNGRYVYLETHPQYVLARVNINMVIDKQTTSKYYKYAIDQAMYIIYTKILEASDGPALYTEDLPFDTRAQIVDYNASDDTYVKILKNEKEGYVLIAQLVEVGKPKEVRLVVKVPSNFYISSTSAKSCTTLGGTEELCEESYSVYNGEAETIELRLYRQRDRGEIVSSVYFDNVIMYNYKVEYSYDSAGQPVYILYLDIPPGSHSLKIITKKLPEVISPDIITKVIIDDNTAEVQTKAKVVNLYSETMPACRVYIPTPCTPTKVYYLTPAGLQDITNERFVSIKTNGVELTVDLYPGKEYEYVVICATDKISVNQLTDDTVADENKIYTDEKAIESSLDSAVQLDIVFKAPTLYPASVKYYTVYIKKNETYFKLPEDIEVQLTIDGIVVSGIVLDKGEKITIGAKWSYVAPIKLRTDKSLFVAENYEEAFNYVNFVRKNYTYSELPERIRKTLDELEQLEKEINATMSKELLYYREALLLRNLTTEYVYTTQELRELLNMYSEETQRKQEAYDQLVEEIEKLQPLIKTIRDIINQKKQQAALEEDLQALKEFEDKLDQYVRELENMKNINLNEVTLEDIQSYIQKVHQVRSKLENLQNQVTQYQVTPKELLDQAAVLVSQIEQLINTYKSKIESLRQDLAAITHPKLSESKQNVEQTLNTIELRIEDLERLKTQAKEVQSLEDLDIIKQHVASIQNEIDAQLASVQRQVTNLKKRQEMLTRQAERSVAPEEPKTTEETLEEEEEEGVGIPILLLGVIGLGALLGLLFILTYLGKLKLPILSDLVEKIKKEKEEQPHEESPSEQPRQPEEGKKTESTLGISGEAPLEEKPLIPPTKEEKVEKSKRPPEEKDKEGTELAPGIRVSQPIYTGETKEHPEEKVEKIVKSAIKEIRQAAGEKEEEETKEGL